MVLSATGLSHSDLVDIANQYFGHLEPSDKSSEEESHYTGGEYRYKLPPRKYGEEINWNDNNNFTRVALAYEIPKGLHNKDFIAISLLQTLLGGGEMRRIGLGGLESRLDREVSSEYYWVQHCKAYTMMHEHSGLFIIEGTAKERQQSYLQQELLQVFIEQLHKCCSTLPSDEELLNAKSVMKKNHMAALEESRMVYMQHLGFQTLIYDDVESKVDFMDKVDAVTAEDLRRVSNELIMQNKQSISLAVAGDEHVDYVPSLDKIKSWL